MNTAIVNVTEYRDLPLAMLYESTTNPRRTFEDDALKELAESIRTQGVLSPLLVRPVNEQGFEIVFGARRYRAARMAEAPTVPVRIKNMTDAETLEAQLIELSIVGKSFLCVHAARYVVYMKTTCRVEDWGTTPNPLLGNAIPGRFSPTEVTNIPVSQEVRFDFR
jgi:ParB family chromosome partitioning protein